MVQVQLSTVTEQEHGYLWGKPQDLKLEYRFSEEIQFYNFRSLVEDLIHTNIGSVHFKTPIHLSILWHLVHVARHELLELVGHILEGPRRRLGISLCLVDGLSILVLILGFELNLLCFMQPQNFFRSFYI